MSGCTDCRDGCACKEAASVLAKAVREAAEALRAGEAGIALDILDRAQSAPQRL